MTLATSPAAHAWSFDAGDTVTGFATCQTVPEAESVPADSVWIDLAATGEIQQSSVDWWSTYFEVRFGNVPAEGSWADVWLYCGVPGEPAGWRFAGSIWVSRPWLTTTALPVWVTA